VTQKSLNLVQGWVALEGHCPAELSSNPYQTHLNKLISAVTFTRKLQAGEFYQVQS